MPQNSNYFLVVFSHDVSEKQAVNNNILIQKDNQGPVECKRLESIYCISLRKKLVIS